MLRGGDGEELPEQEGVTMSGACERKIGDLVIVLGQEEFDAARGKAFIGLRSQTHPTTPRATALFSDDGGFSTLHVKPVEIWQERSSGNRVLVMRPIRLDERSPGEH